MKVLVTVLNWIFGIACIWSLLMVIVPVLCEKLAVNSSRFAGMDFGAVVKSRRTYRRTIRIAGGVLLAVLVPSWLVFAVLLKLLGITG